MEPAPEKPTPSERPVRRYLGQKNDGTWGIFTVFLHPTLAELERKIVACMELYKQVEYDDDS